MSDLKWDRAYTEHGITGIPFQSKKAYAEHINVDVDDFINLITEIDDALVKLHGDKHSKKDKGITYGRNPDTETGT